MKKIILLAENGLLLAILNVLNIYYSRELTLLYNRNYTSFLGDRDEYIKFCFEQLSSFYDGSYETITSLFTNNIFLSDKNTKKIGEKMLIVYSYVKDYDKVKITSLPIKTAIIEINTALFKICHDTINSFISTNKDVYYFMVNAKNCYFEGADFLRITFLDELKIIEQNLKLIFLILLIFIIFILILVYFFLNYGYKTVEQKREAYLQIFFNVGNDIVKNH